MPGWYKESVGYHTDDRNIYHNDMWSDKNTGGMKSCAYKNENSTFGHLHESY